jgi:NAD(P)-dependent dehydrogenase (short-subunit alcohol dehydrogenase family)
MRYQGRHIVVTGASSGIGRAIAVRLGEEGASVSLLARRAADLDETAGLVEGAGGGARAFACDVTDPAALEGAFSDAVAHFGPLFACVANAGVGGPNSAGPDDRFRVIVETNLFGTYHTFRAAQRRLLADGTKHLVATSSILGRFGVPGYTGYCASKAAILGLVRAFALELARKNVQVNAICPGWVETDMAWEGIDAMAAAMGVDRAKALAQAMKPVPLGRMGKPSEVAGTVAWLLSEDAGGVTGQGIDINGGAWMG